VIIVLLKMKSPYQISKVVNTLLEVHVSYTVEVRSVTLTADLPTLKSTICYYCFPRRFSGVSVHLGL